MRSYAALPIERVWLCCVHVMVTKMGHLILFETKAQHGLGGSGSLPKHSLQ